MRIINKKLMCQNSKFYIYFNHIIDDTYKIEIPDFLVVVPKDKNENGISGVALLPINGDEVGLIKMFRPPIDGWSWEIPHGFIEQGESEFEAAKRELLEETGFTLLNIKSLGVVAPDAGVIDGRVKLFSCMVNQDQSMTAPELGLREFKWIKFNDFENKILKSEIQDSFTIAAWCKFKLISE